MITQILNVKKVVALLIASLLLAGSFGMSHMMGMKMDAEGRMTNCPFMPGVSICNMTPMEIIAASQSLLNSMIVQHDFALLLLLASAITLIAFISFLAPPKISRRYKVPKQRQRLKYSFLQEAFSNGILNPKLF